MLVQKSTTLAMFRTMIPTLRELRPRSLHADMSQVQVCRVPRGVRPSCSYLADQPLVSESVRQTLDCCFCMKTAMRPVQHKCGAVFCDACVEQWQVAQHNANRFTKCPTCRDYLDYNLVHAALPVRQILMLMLAKCDNCAFEGSVDCVLHHVQNQTQFVCVNRCGAVNLTLATMQEHYDMCAQQVHASCSYDCGMHGQRSAVHEHMQRCENRNNGERFVSLQVEMRFPLSHFCPLQMLVDVQFADGSFEKAQIAGYTQLGLILRSESRQQAFEASVFERNADIGAHAVLDLRVQVKHVHCPVALTSHHSHAVDAMGKLRIPSPVQMGRGASGVSQEDVLRAGQAHDTAAAQQQQQQHQQHGA